MYTIGPPPRPESGRAFPHNMKDCLPVHAGVTARVNLYDTVGDFAARIGQPIEIIAF